MQFNRTHLGTLVKIVTTRDYGPYLDKPSLPAGEYTATLTGVGTQGPSFEIERGPHRYNILGKDVASCIVH